MINHKNPLASRNFLSDKNSIKVYGSDASGIDGKALGVILPRNIQEVRVAVASAKRIVIRGAGSGLVGGCVPQGGLDVVLDMSRLDKISEPDAGRKTIEVEAGVLLSDLQNYIRHYNLEFPVDSSCRAVATIGGMIASNIVGARAVKYGKISNWINWLEVIDAEGKLQKKSVSELSDYFGMEGISGVIVRACLKLSSLKERRRSLLKIDSIDKIVPIVRGLKRNSEVSMIEFMDKKISEGLGLGGHYHLIVEYEGSGENLTKDEVRDLLNLRDKIYPFVFSEGYTRVEDVKVRTDRFVEIISWLEERGVPFFAHIGSGIFHPYFNFEQRKYIPELMKLVKRLGGQISGEYGIGILKKEFVDAIDRKILVNIKKRTDPLNKFNIGKMI